MQQKVKTIAILSLLSYSIGLKAHPAGNIITVDEHVLWSYVCPTGDIEHHACVMIWDRKTKPRPFFTSEYPASDFALYAKNDDIYMVESRYVNSRDIFESRILKARLDKKPSVIWPWFTDTWKIGGNGMMMIDDQELIFGNYPNVYKLRKGAEAEVHFTFPDNIVRIRPVEENWLLLLSDNNCWLTDLQGTVLRSWKDLPEKNLQDAPMGRNTIFDAAYRDGELLIAYWGKRSFESIDRWGNRQVLVREPSPWTPHWVAFLGDQKLLFASYLDFNNPIENNHSTIKPKFQRYNEGKIHLIWN